jgi:hypothetical protein
MVLHREDGLPAASAAATAEAANRATKFQIFKHLQRAPTSLASSSIVMSPSSLACGQVTLTFIVLSISLDDAEKRVDLRCGLRRDMMVFQNTLS